jgi:succinate dehydrogenase/fumarate reductase cytochrome b subunit
MAGNTQMNDSERGVFSLIHGVTGMLIATVLLLSILAVLTINAIAVQQSNAETFYEVNQDLHALKMNSPDNINHRTIK